MLTRRKEVTSVSVFGIDILVTVGGIPRVTTEILLPNGSWVLWHAGTGEVTTVVDTATKSLSVPSHRGT